MIKTALTLKIVLAVLTTALLATCACAGRPIILVFEANPGEGTGHALAVSTTKALRNYLRDTQRVEATIFNRESPAITRAIMEKRLTPDQVASYSSEQEKTKVAEVLLFGYACGSNISFKDGRVTLKLWVAKAGGGKRDRWEATGVAASGGTGDLDMDNAMQSAASSAVHNISAKAFSDLPQVPEAQPTKGNESTALNAGQVPQQTKLTPDDYVGAADKNLKAGNIALAIQQYSRAVDIDPTNPGLRLKLVEAYEARGMFDEAESELSRAEKAGAKAETLAAARDKLQKLRNGIEPAEPPKTPQSPNNTQQPSESIVMTNRNPSIAKIVEGDKLWNDGKPDEAAEAYKTSVKLNPEEWRAWERLAIVDASMSLFGESRKAVEELKKVQPNAPAATIENRYEMLRKAFDAHFNSLLSHYDTSARGFAGGTMSHEAYYADANGLAVRLEAMAKFLDSLDVPSAKQPANLRRSLACGLMAQAASSLTDFLETNSKTARDNAAVFAAAARKALGEAQKLDSNTVSISK